MAKNFTLLLTTIFLLFILGEWLFPRLLGKLPLRLYGSIETNLRILAQSSKKDLLPNEYIAIAGDSYAVGSGDWLDEARKKSFLGSPDYSPAHLIYKKIGIDVVSFGQGGVGSFGGIWKEPITQFLYINSVKNFQLFPPKVFLVFFYEGNDIYNNVQFIRGKFLSIQKGSQKNKIALNEVPAFLNLEFQNVLNGDYDRSLWKNLLFTRSFIQGILNLMKELSSLNKNHTSYFPFPKTPISLALINGTQTPLPMHLQGPPLFFKASDPILGQKDFSRDEQLKEFYITEEEYKLGLYVFEQALAALVEFFSQAEIKVIFIPSPLSSYQMISPKVSYRGMVGNKGLMETAIIKKRHVKICESIKTISLASGASFLNTTKSLRKVSSQGFIHGPVDWDHFNKAGYEALSTDIAKVFLKPKGIARVDNCID